MDKVTRLSVHRPQLLKRKESRSRFEPRSFWGLSAYQPNAFPLGQTGSRIAKMPHWARCSCRQSRVHFQRLLRHSAGCGRKSYRTLKKTVMCHCDCGVTVLLWCVTVIVESLWQCYVSLWLWSHCDSVTCHCDCGVTVRLQCVIARLWIVTVIVESLWDCNVSLCDCGLSLWLWSHCEIVLCDCGLSLWLWSHCEIVMCHCGSSLCHCVVTVTW